MLIPVMRDREVTPPASPGDFHRADVERAGVDRKCAGRDVRRLRAEPEAAEPARDPSAVSTGRSPIRLLALVGAALLAFSAAYLMLARVLLPGYLRTRAERAGLELRFASLRSFYPGDLRLEGLELEVPSAGVSLHARAIEASPRLRALLSDEPVLDRAQATGVHLRWNGGWLGPFDATVRLQDDSGTRGWLAVDAARTTLRTAGKSFELTLRARLELEQWWSEEGQPLRARVGDGVIEASDVRLTAAPNALPPSAPGPAGPGLQVIVRAESGRFSSSGGFSLLGSGYVRGPDAGVVLDLVQADEAARWMLEELVGQPFEVEAALQLCGSGLELDELRLETGLTHGTGALITEQGQLRGALLLRRGSLAMGLATTSTGWVASLAPEPRWLATARAALDDVCSGSPL